MNVLDTVTETVDQARRRLAEKARTEGVTLSLDDDGRWYASSVSTPGRRYLVTGYSCTCVGFCNHGRCKHNSALLACRGWLDLDLDDDPEPTPAAALPCPTCQDTGEVVVRHSRWIGGSRLGFRDEWSTLATCHECRGEEVAA